jgi:hypothetical protein
MVSGTVVRQNPAAKGAITVLLEWERVPTASTTTVHPDGTFSFPAMAPLKFRVRLGGSGGFFASEIHVEGAGGAR